MRARSVLVASLCLSASLFASGWKLYPATNPDAKLPRVLIVGDSICNAYRHTVVAKLKGKANVDAWVTPYHIAAPQLMKRYKEILAATTYDVIHFNHGLHGFGDRIPKGKYVEILESYVVEIKKAAPQAKIIWCATTPVNKKGDNAVLDPVMTPVVIKRNALAAELMKRYDIPVTDLYTLVVGKPELRAKPADPYHYNGEGRKLQGEFIADVLSKILAAKK
ncbi:MAG: SGNH/GDSL hydrolase family protein [Victivallales bacterium]|nr:SGNH/GDSL hydrolase family protein [Victivallales bacterium]